MAGENEEDSCMLDSSGEGRYRLSNSKDSVYKKILLKLLSSR